MNYSIGEAAKLIGVAPSAIRFYEKEGLLPFARRSDGGRRVFTETDLEWLKIIECLKTTNMPLKDMKLYIQLAAQGDGTIDERLELFEARRRAVEDMIAGLNATLRTIDYKIWYYRTAKERGSTESLKNLKPEDVPQELRAAMLSLKCNE